MGLRQLDHTGQRLCDHFGPADHDPGRHRDDATTGVVTGTNTNFTSSLVGQWLQFSSDPNSAHTASAPGDLSDREHYQYDPAHGHRVEHRRSSRAGSQFTGSFAAITGTPTMTVQSYTNLALHEYAIALALRPIATPDEARNVVDVSYIDLMGIPLRVMVSYVHIYQALFVTVDFGYALGVIRPDFGVIIQS